jgi:hypothetical protein
MSWWKANAWWLTLALTLAVCVGGLLMGVPPVEVMGVFLFGLVLTTVNRLARKDETR